MLPVHATIETFALATTVRIDLQWDGAKEPIRSIHNKARSDIWSHAYISSSCASDRPTKASFGFFSKPYSR